VFENEVITEIPQRN